MGEVIQLDGWTSGSGAGMICSCGSAWFRLVGADGGVPAVTLTEAGSITGYAGTPVCAECGRTPR